MTVSGQEFSEPVSVPGMQIDMFDKIEENNKGGLLPEKYKVWQQVSNDSQKSIIKDKDGVEWYRWVISDNTPDRGGDVVPAEAWDIKNFNKNGLCLYMHKMGSNGELVSDPDRILGPAKVMIEDGKLIGFNRFEPEDINPLASKIKKKVDFGTLNATSVGYILHKAHMGVEHDGEDTGHLYFDLAELVEFSIVDIPMNPNALRKSFHTNVDEYIKTHIKPDTHSTHRSTENALPDTEGDEAKSIDEDFARLAHLSFLKRKNFERCLKN